ncbi:hypothetical protein HH310_07395 [Actinoplanes sp. TBRC 11911]|uniref:hypothetical protein n=1 Tax=Actinoplanes sp. TBRC 11911 TaxID=2729386 RepID=UPI00145D9DF4|nr:hypothetical protein [Actinoplanes sp. TBRC 11911]NMO51013.1 hypothetical protein [Actinoplanes sp. TBRC 11911]
MRRSAATAVAAVGVVGLSALFGPPAFAAEAATSPKIVSVTVNGGRDIVVSDLTTDLEVPVTAVAQAKAGVAGIGVALWHGPNFNHIDGMKLGRGTPSCVTVNLTTMSCTDVIDIQGSLRANLGNPISENDLAGRWAVDAGGTDNNGGFSDDPHFATVNVLRKARITAETSRTQVKKGKNVTFTGSIKRVDLDTSKFKGYDEASVQLQFSREGTDVFTTVMTVKASDGEFSATVAANRDGRWRWNYAGDKTTSAATSPVRFVNVV